MNILITGAEQGLGKAIAQASTERGWQVHNLSGDIFQSVHLKDAVIEAIQLLPSLSIVVNNFGINHLSWIGETGGQDEQILRINVMGPYWVINALAQRDSPCKVLNISSITYRIPQRCTSLYAASKAALVQMTKVMARELAPKGWQLNAFCPGKITDTKMAALTDAQIQQLRGWTEEYIDGYAKSLVPMGRFTTTAECAQMVMLLLDAPDYLNGAVIDFSGAV